MKELTIQAYKSKQFIKARRLSLQYLRNQEKIEILDPVLNIFFIVESDLSKMDFFLDKVYEKDAENPKRVFKLMYLLLEKGYVGKDTYIGKKWGDIFLREGGESRYYAKGVLLYSGLLYLAEERKKSAKIIKSINPNNLKGNWKKKFEFLKIALKNKERKVALQAQNYIKIHPKENYSDFAYAIVIQSYIQMKDMESAKEWKKKLDVEYPQSVFRDAFSEFSE